MTATPDKPRIRVSQSWPRVWVCGCYNANKRWVCVIGESPKAAYDLWILYLEALREKGLFWEVFP